MIFKCTIFFNSNLTWKTLLVRAECQRQSLNPHCCECLSFSLCGSYNIEHFDFLNTEVHRAVRRIILYLLVNLHRGAVYTKHNKAIERDHLRLQRAVWWLSYSSFSNGKNASQRQAINLLLGTSGSPGVAQCQEIAAWLFLGWKWLWLFIVSCIHVL